MPPELSEDSHTSSPRIFRHNVPKPVFWQPFFAHMYIYRTQFILELPHRIHSKFVSRGLPRQAAESAITRQAAVSRGQPGQAVASRGKPGQAVAGRGKPRQAVASPV